MAKLSQLCATALWVSTIVVILIPVLCRGTKMYSESEAAEYLDKANKALTAWSKRVVNFDWYWSTNITRENAMRMFGVNAEFTKFLRIMNKETHKYPWTTYKDPNIRRQFQLFSELGAGGLSEENLNKFDRLIWTMKTIYSNATISDYRSLHQSVESDVTAILAKSTDVKELQHVWVEWREASGKKIRPLFPEYVRMFNENAKLSNYTNAAEFWTRKFEMKDFRETMEHLWQQVKPLYLQLFAYVRRRLWLRYGTLVLSRRGPIPVHILGDMWAQSWEKLTNFTLPFPDVGVINPSRAMIEKGYTTEKMFKTAEEFYKSLDFGAFPESFWKNSILKRPVNRHVLCNAGAWDFHDAKDFRIKQCPSVHFDDFLTTHKLMGQVHYAMQYKHQPYIYREGAFEGFQETVGEAISLSIMSPDHMHNLGLFPNTSRPFKDDINYLYSIALDKVAFIPFAYVMDLWRWNVFDETTLPNEYNCDWWDLRYNYQGYKPPVVRTERDFDPGAKCHIIGNVPYIRYFLSTIMQFQFHQALCEKAGEYDPNNPKSKPLHECNIYKNKKAGNVLKEMMKLGKSKPWSEALEVLAGTRVLDATPMLNYFKPLHEWLAKRNDETGERIGWRTSKTMCVRTT